MARPQGLTRPLCPYCAKPLRKEVKYHHFSAGNEPNTLDECRARFNGEVTSVRWFAASRRLTAAEIEQHKKTWPHIKADDMTTKDESRPRVIYACNVWEGGYGSYGGFCTMRCAADFAVSAYAAGYRVTRRRTG